MARPVLGVWALSGLGDSTQGKPAFDQVWENGRVMMTDRKPVVDEDRLKAVTRYRSVEEMPPPWRDANDPGNLRNVALMMAFYTRMTPDTGRPRGVRRFKSIEEANADRGDPYRMERVSR